MTNFPSYDSVPLAWEDYISWLKKKHAENRQLFDTIVLSTPAKNVLRKRFEGSKFIAGGDELHFSQEGIDFDHLWKNVEATNSADESSSDSETEYEDTTVRSLIDEFASKASVSKDKQPADQ